MHERVSNRSHDNTPLGLETVCDSFSRASSVRCAGHFRKFHTSNRTFSCAICGLDPDTLKSPQASAIHPARTPKYTSPPHSFAKSTSQRSQAQAASAPDLIERALLRQTPATPRPDDRPGVRTISRIEPAGLAVANTGAGSGFHWSDAGFGAGTALILVFAASHHSLSRHHPPATMRQPVRAYPSSMKDGCCQRMRSTRRCPFASVRRPTIL
jgi:hypothetical protein